MNKLMDDMVYKMNHILNCGCEINCVNDCKYHSFAWFNIRSSIHDPLHITFRPKRLFFLLSWQENSMLYHFLNSNRWALYFSAELEERMTLTAKNMLKREKHFGNKSVKEKEILIRNSIWLKPGVVVDFTVAMENYWKYFAPTALQ